MIRSLADRDIHSSTRGRMAWLVGLGLGLAVCLAFLAVPAGSTASTILYGIGGAGALATVTVAAVRMPVGVRAIWWAVWGYVLLTLAGDLAFFAASEAGDAATRPAPSDVAYLAAYAFAFAALVLLVRAVYRGQDAEAWVDTLILALAAAALIGLIVVAPTVAQSDASTSAVAVALTYLLVDLVILSGLIRVLVGARRVNAAIALLLVGFTLTFAADLAQSYLEAYGMGSEATTWIDTLFLLSLVALAAAATAPGAMTISRASIEAMPAITSTRVAGLAVGALAVPIMFAVVAWRDDNPTFKILTISCVVVIVLVLWRFRLLLAVAQDQATILSSLARTDSLTGLANRRTLDFELERVEAQATASGLALTIAMMDLDHFKDYNDVHGHQAGDEVLVACATAWQSALPSTAFLARYGGEEFAVLLPGEGLRTAEPILEGLRLASPGPQTVSIGFAERRPGESGYETMRRADRALYLAKQAGRNRAVADRGAPSRESAP